MLLSYHNLYNAFILNTTTIKNTSSSEAGHDCSLQTNFLLIFCLDNIHVKTPISFKKTETYQVNNKTKVYRVIKVYPSPLQMELTTRFLPSNGKSLR